MFRHKIQQFVSEACSTASVIVSPACLCGMLCVSYCGILCACKLLYKLLSCYRIRHDMSDLSDFSFCCLCLAKLLIRFADRGLTYA